MPLGDTGKNTGRKQDTMTQGQTYKIKVLVDEIDAHELARVEVNFFGDMPEITAFIDNRLNTLRAALAAITCHEKAATI